MKHRRILAAALACALSLSLLSACGGKSGSSFGSQPGSSSSVSSGSDASTPDASQPDASDPSASEPYDGDISFTLNKSEVTLKKAGATFQLRYTADPEVYGTSAVFTSSDEKVAAVGEDGTIQAVAPGKAVITVSYAGAAAECTVTCDWKEEAAKPEPKPEPKPDASKPAGGSSSSSGSASSSAPAASQVDLQAFYDATVGKYEFGFLQLADAELLDQLYPGLSGVSAEQKLVYVIMLSMNNGEFGLVQVEDSKDVDTVKAIFQARIDNMSGANGGQPGAWYPGPTEQWLNNSRVVSNGNYVMMVVHENCDDIVNEFNALFQ